MKNLNIRNIIAKFFLALVLTAGLSSLALANSTTANTRTTDSFSFSNRFRVNGYQARAHKFYFYAGEQVDIEIFGDGDTDLDLYVYDASGNLCAKRDGSSDYESIVLDVYRSEYFTVKVVNRGDVYNDYELLVDAY